MTSVVMTGRVIHGAERLTGSLPADVVSCRPPRPLAVLSPAPFCPGTRTTTFAPSVSRSCPSVITRWPTVSPPVKTTSESVERNTFTFTTRAFCAESTTHTTSPAWPLCTEEPGTTSALRWMSSCSETRTSEPGHNAASVLGKLALSATVPVSESTELSRKINLPVSSLVESATGVAVTASDCDARVRTASKLSAGTGKRTRIGDIWLSTTRLWPAPLRT